MWDRRILALLLLYVCVAAVSGLDWGLFRDEPRYLDAAVSLAGALPRAEFPLDVFGVSLSIWGLLYRAGATSPVVLRSVQIVFAALTILLVARVAVAWRSPRPWAAALLVGLLPQFFVYAYQINGAVLATFLSTWILYVYTQWHLSSAGWSPVRRRLMTAYLFLVLALGCIQYPFTAAYPAAIVLLEGYRYRRRRTALGERTLPVAVACLCAFIGYVLFLAHNGCPVSASMKLHSWRGVNPPAGPFYLGNWVILLAYLGGMFPFLPGAFAGRIRWAVLLPLLLVAWALCYACLPIGGHPYHEGFHTIFTSTLDTVLVRGLGLPERVVAVALFALVGLGTYNLAHIVRSWKTSANPEATVFAVTALCVFMSLILVDGYISSRLFIPGLIGLFLVIAHTLAPHRRLYWLQLGYQACWCAAYAVALGMKHGFMGLGGGQAP
jgi:hypothetical protein